MARRFDGRAAVAQFGQLGSWPLTRTIVRSTEVFRVLTCCYAITGFVAVRRDEYATLWGPALVLLAMVVWTAVMWWTPDRSWRRHLADVIVTVIIIMLGLATDDPTRVAAGGATLVGMWAAAAAVSWAATGGFTAGVLAACAVSVPNLLYVVPPHPGAINLVTLLLFACGALGMGLARYRNLVGQLVGEREAQAARVERERLAAQIHDSVLQNLAFVQRRAAELGGDVAELGKAAGESQEQLRQLMAQPTTSHRARQELMAQLRSVVAGKPVAGRVQVSGPQQVVGLTTDVVEAVSGAVGAALDNVAAHAGPDAQVWLFVDDDPAGVQVSVRDDGPGFATGRLAQAAGEGRMGVRLSIIGRMQAVGGDASLESTPGGGTEVELVCPPVRP